MVVVSVRGTACVIVSCTSACAPCAIRPETLHSVSHDVQAAIAIRTSSKNELKNHVTLSANENSSFYHVTISANHKPSFNHMTSTTSRD